MVCAPHFVVQANIEKPAISEYVKVKQVRGIPHAALFNPKGKLVVGELRGPHAQ